MVLPRMTQNESVQQANALNKTFSSSRKNAFQWWIGNFQSSHLVLLPLLSGIVTLVSDPPEAQSFYTSKTSILPRHAGKKGAKHFPDLRTETKLLARASKTGLPIEPILTTIWVLILHKHSWILNFIVHVFPILNEPYWCCYEQSDVLHVHMFLNIYLPSIRIFGHVVFVLVQLHKLWPAKCIHTQI